MISSRGGRERPRSGGIPTAVTCSLLAAVASASVLAQAPATAVAPLPSAFVGVGFGPSSNDAQSRMRLFEEGVATTFVIEAGAALADRVGMGVEYSQPSAATAFTSVGAGRAQVAGRQEERVILGVVRGRLAGSRRWALDAVGGAGVLFHHHVRGGCVPAVTRCDDTSGPSVDERAAAFVFGVDVPVRLARRFELAAAVRVYNLRRGEHTSAQDINLSWPFEWRSSTRAAITLNGRVVW